VTSLADEVAALCPCFTHFGRCDNACKCLAQRVKVDDVTFHACVDSHHDLARRVGEKEKDYREGKAFAAGVAAKMIAGGKYKLRAETAISLLQTYRDAHKSMALYAQEAEAAEKYRDITTSVDEYLENL